MSGLNEGSRGGFVRWRWFSPAWREVIAYLVSFSLAAFSAIHDIHNDDTSQQAGQKGRTAIDYFVFFVIVSFFHRLEQQHTKAGTRSDQASGRAFDAWKVA